MKVFKAGTFISLKIRNYILYFIGRAYLNQNWMGINFIIEELIMFEDKIRTSANVPTETKKRLVNLRESLLRSI